MSAPRCATIASAKAIAAAYYLMIRTVPTDDGNRFDVLRKMDHGPLVFVGSARTPSGLLALVKRAAGSRAEVAS